MHGSPMRLKSCKLGGVVPNLKTAWWFKMLVAFIGNHSILKRSMQKSCKSPDEAAWNEMQNGSHRVMKGRRGTKHQVNKGSSPTWLHTLTSRTIGSHPSSNSSKYLVISYELRSTAPRDHGESLYCCVDDNKNHFKSQNPLKFTLCKMAY